MSSAVDGDVLSALEAQHAELAGIIDPLDEAAWQRPSRCEGWSVADVVLHLVQTDQLAMASLADRIDAEVASIASGDAPVANVDEGAELAVQRERGLSGAELAARWHARSSELRAAFARDDPHRRVTWVAGTLTVRTLAATRLSEAWIHTGDVAVAFGPPPTTHGSPVSRRPSRLADAALRVRPFGTQPEWPGRLPSACPERRDVGVRA